MAYKQKVGRVEIPSGKNVAVALGFDFDAMSIWDGSFHKWSPATQSRGEFGAEVATPRLLKLLNKYNVKSTWFIPGHTADSFPEACEDVIKHDHEIGHHGYVHENPTEVGRDRETEVLQKGIESLQRLTGKKPRGYRSPYWDFSPNTLDILEELGFEWDSSLMANDLHPYYPRRVNQEEYVQHGQHQVANGPSTFGEPASILEVPVSWYLDDFPTQEFFMGLQEGMQSLKQVEERWTSIYDYAAKEEGAVYALTMHPQTIGRAHTVQLLEKLIRYFLDNGAEFMTVSEVADATRFE